MLFKEDFIADAIPLKAFRDECAFLNYGGTPAFNLGPTEAREIQGIILKINEEIKRKGSNLKQIIQLYIHLLLLQAKRSYENTPPHKPKTANNLLLTQYKKLVSQHFSTLRQVSDYAKMLNVTSNHLNKVIKSESGRTAHALIAEMLMLEAKALILHTSLSISEIAWKLDFADPSYFNKFFKKHSGMTPLQLRRP